MHRKQGHWPLRLWDREVAGCKVYQLAAVSRRTVLNWLLLLKRMLMWMKGVC